MDDDWLPPLPADLPRIVHVRDAAKVGLTPRTLAYRAKQGRFRRVLPRTYLTTDTLTWLDRCYAALAFAGPRTLLSGAAALDLADVRGVRRPDRLLVLVPADCWVRSTGFVQIRRTDRLPRPAPRSGPACVPMARAVADRALTMRRLDDVRALVAETVRRRHCSLAELSAELADGPRNGSAHLRLAIEEVAGGAWSAPEARAARLLRRAGVPPFEANATIRLPDDRKLIVDFLWPQLRAVLEIDSDEHHGLPPDADRTDERDIVLETLGYSVVHRRPYVVNRQPERFVTAIQTWLAARAAALHDQ